VWKAKGETNNEHNNTDPEKAEFEAKIKSKRTVATKKATLNHFVGTHIHDIGNQANAISKKVNRIKQLILGFETIFDLHHLISFEGDVEVHIKERIDRHKAETEAITQEAKQMADKGS